MPSYPSIDNLLTRKLKLSSHGNEGLKLAPWKIRNRLEFHAQLSLFCTKLEEWVARDDLFSSASSFGITSRAVGRSLVLVRSIANEAT